MQVLLFACVALGPVAARADTDLCIAINARSLTLLQGADGTITYYLTDNCRFAVVLDIVPKVGDAIKVRESVASKDGPGGDGDVAPNADYVSSALRNGGTCGVGSTLEPSNSDSTCTITVKIVSDDARRRIRDPDNDYGIWNIDLDPTGHNFDNNKPVRAFGGTWVTVTDCTTKLNAIAAPTSVCAPTPEPSSLLLISGALALTGLGSIVIRGLGSARS